MLTNFIVAPTWGKIEPAREGPTKIETPVFDVVACRGGQRALRNAARSADFVW